MIRTLRRAAIYARVSTKRQVVHDLSIPEQIAVCKRYCSDHGFEVAEIFVEPGISGKEESRPEFQRLLAEALSSDHPYDVVVVFSVSRFARDLAIGEWFIRQLAQARVGFRAVMDGEFEGADGVLLRQMKGMVAQNLSTQNAISTSAAMNANADAGFWNGGPPPFGYRTEVVERRGKKEKKKLVVDLVEGPIVIKIFDLALHGDGQSGPMGCKAIVDWLNARGYRTRQGNLFHIAPLYSLLHRTHYIGYYEFGRKSAQTGAVRPDDLVKRIACPPIVDREIWDAVHESMRARNPKAAPPRTVSGPTLLTGLARCSICKSRMTLRTGKSGRYKYYACANAATRGAVGCSGMSIRMDELDSVATSELLAKVLKPERLASILQEMNKRDARRHSNLDAERLKVSTDFEAKKTGLDRLYAAIESGLADLDDDLFRQRVEAARLEFKIATEAKARVEKRDTRIVTISTDQIAGFAALMERNLTSGSVPFRKSYIATLVDQIDVSGDAIKIRGKRSRLKRGLMSATEKVPSPIQEWRARKDSNL
jgi:site-specific DNA recombinase